jgi:hypothetical protein
VLIERRREIFHNLVNMINNLISPLKTSSSTSVDFAQQRQRVRAETAAATAPAASIRMQIAPRSLCVCVRARERWILRRSQVAVFLKHIHHSH